MTFKRILLLSILIGFGAGLAAYALAWGLFTTHQELGMDARSALALAAWTMPLAFAAAMIYFAIRNAGRR